MKAFRYARPGTLDEVLALLDEHGPGASLLAGGTDLLVRLRAGAKRATPQVVIDMKRVKALGSDIAACAVRAPREAGPPSGVETGSFLRIGALAVMADIIEDERVRRDFPALVEAAATVGSVQIRNRATLAGNICNASPAADTAPALLVYGAVINLVGIGGRRGVPVNEFFLGPGQTVLRRGELVESLDLPLPQEKVGAAFARLTRRRGVDLATVSACCLVKASGLTLFAYGAAGPRPFLVSDDSGRLADPYGDPQEKERILQHLISYARPISDVRGSREYRWAMLWVMSRRALQAALDRLHASEQRGCLRPAQRG